MWTCWPLKGSMICRILIMSGLLMAGCSRKQPTLVASPTGQFLAQAVISGKEAGPTRRNCVVLLVTDAKAGTLVSYQTGASNFQKWALDWADPQTLVFYSSDIGTYAYDITSEGITERTATDEEQSIATSAYQAKYASR